MDWRQAVTEETPLRRVPQQDRGQRRVDKILEAAAQLFAEVGYEAATTNAIAAKANTSIGSLYQFFPNKEAILHALATRYLEQLRAMYDMVLTGETACLPLPVLLDRIIDPLAAFKLSHPGFDAIVAGANSSPSLAATAAELHHVLIQRVEAIFAARAATLESTHLRLYASVSVAVAEALFPLAESNKVVPRSEFLAEIKRLLLVYLEPVIGFESNDG